MQISECLTQMEVDNAFAAWIGQFLLLEDAIPGVGSEPNVAPEFCGGSVTVIYN